MASLTDPRRRLPLTPSLKLFREQLHIEPVTGTNAPSSPPESPSATPQMAGKSSQAGAFYRFSRPLAQDPNIKPVGNGHQFSYRRTVRGLEQLSPKSSSSSSDPKEDMDDKSSLAYLTRPRSVAASFMADLSDDEGDADEEDGGNDMSNVDDEGNENDVHESVEEEEEEEEKEGKKDDSDDADEAGPAAHREARAGPSLRLASDDSSCESVSVAGSDVDGVAYRSRLHVASSRGSSLVGDFVVEYMDPMDGDCEGLEILHPTEIESPRNRSRSHHRGFDRGMVRDFKKLNCSNETSDDEEGEHHVSGVDADVMFWQRQKEVRRFRRLSTASSVAKRTHSELDSESGDSEVGGMDVNDVGSSARRMRKRQHRGAGLPFQDPPAPRIDELEEPESSAEDSDAADPFARELPYFPMMEIMEMDSA
ncbi:hypothetical protein E4U42_002519 [Claviceps africana]|uniref:Uncharacterized protein n=1 Tax=Claviceps africana TaxID=83212 RepID=A0A8K0J865_9HYPO|nr:hypothetical protein E4U42_002519 [Claviceps africana]